jgi:hypothetical protein
MLLAFFLGFLGLLLLAGGGVLGLFAWRNLRAASLLGRPLSHIGKVRPGLRRVRGRVVPLDDILHSPATRKECVYYRLRVYEDRTTWQSTTAIRGGVAAASLLAGGAVGGSLLAIRLLSDQDDSRAVHSWHHLLDETVRLPFLIEDDTGLVEVDLRDADVVAKEKTCIDTNFRHPVLALTRLTDKLREEHDIHTVDERGNLKTLHIVEEVLLVGTKVTVVGTVEPVENGELCFVKSGALFLVSERDVGKVAKSARNCATGFTAGAAAALAVALVLLVAAFILTLRALLAR